jgi:hypothetical protein
MYASKAQEYLDAQSMPSTDGYELKRSEHRFPDGAHYRIEVPTINSPAALRALLGSLENFDVTVNRLSVTYGIMRFLDEEIIDMLDQAREYGAEVFMMVGPRAVLDIGAQAHIHTLNAQHVAYRLRGTDQLVYGLEDALRAIDLGCRGILVCDQGLLYVLNQMRKDGTIPPDVQFKASVLLGTTNYAAMRVIADIGADSVNIQRDMPLPMIAGFRMDSDLPIDVHANNPDQTGGFLRTFDVPEMVLTSAPIYIKTGNIAVPSHSMMVDEGAGLRMAREVAMTERHIRKYAPESVQTKRHEKSLAIPVARG